MKSSMMVDVFCVVPFCGFEISITGGVVVDLGFTHPMSIMGLAFTLAKSSDPAETDISGTISTIASKILFALQHELLERDISRAPALVVYL
jgi:hypothetical protein